MKEVMQEKNGVALDVLHRAAHAGVALAKAKVVGRVVLGRLAPGPVPATAVLEVDDVDGVVADNRAARLETQVIDATQALFEHLRSHDGRADGENHAAIEIFDRRAEQAEIEPGSAAD